MISLVARGEGHRMVPQPSSFTGAQKNGEFTAGRVLSIAGWCLLSAVAQQWSGHGCGLQIIGGSFLDRDLRGSCLFHKADGRAVSKTARHLRCSRAAGKKREACSGGDHTNPFRYFRMFRIHAIRALVRWSASKLVGEDCRSISDVSKFDTKFTDISPSVPEGL